MAFPDNDTDTAPAIVTMKASDFAAAPSATPTSSPVTMKASDFAVKAAPTEPQLVTMHASEFTPGAVSGMEQLGGVPPAPPRPPIVQMQPSALGRSPLEGLVHTVATPIQGAADIYGGAKVLAGQSLTPALRVGAQVTGHGADLKPAAPLDWPKILNAGSDIVEGTFKASEPLVIAAAVTNPLSTIATVGTAYAADKAGSEAAKALGASPELQRFTGNVAAFAAMGIGGKRILDRMDSVIEQHNTAAQTLLESERSTGLTQDRIDRIFQGEAYPVQLGDAKAELRYGGKGQWQVVSQDGKVLRGGKGPEVRQWLSDQGARPIGGEAAPIEATAVEPTPIVRAWQQTPGVQRPVVPGTNRPFVPPSAAERPAGPLPDLKPAPPSTPVHVDLGDRGALEAFTENVAERWRDIQSMEQAATSGHDVQMSPDTMRLTTPEQRLQMLQDNIADHRKYYEAEWQQFAQDVGPEAAQGLRQRVESYAKAAAVLQGEAPSEAPPVKKGSVFPSPQGPLTVSRVTKAKVVYSIEGQDGLHSLPLADFQALVKPQAVPEKSPTVPPSQEPGSPVPPAQPSPEAGAAPAQEQQIPPAGSPGEPPVPGTPVTSGEPAATSVPTSGAIPLGEYRTDKGTYKVIESDGTWTRYEFNGKPSVTVPTSAFQKIAAQAEKVSGAPAASQTVPPVPPVQPSPATPAGAEPAQDLAPPETTGTAATAGTNESGSAQPAAAPASPAPAEAHDYSSTQANLTGPVVAQMQAFEARIPKAKLDPEKGLEPEKHITVKYGNPGTDPAPIIEALQGKGPVTITFDKMKVFKGKDGKPDTLVVLVKGQGIHDLNAVVGKAVEHTGNTFPDYLPHATIGYFKPGEADPWDGKSLPGVTGESVTLNSITFSGKDGKLTEIPLTGPSSEAASGPEASAETASTAAREPWQMTREQFFNDPDLVRAHVDGGAPGYKVSYAYVNPGPAGPSKGSMVMPKSPKKGDVIPAMFGKATVTAVSKAAPAKLDNQQLFDKGKVAHRQIVEDALAAGKPVPPEVLADYPDLQAPPADAATPRHAWQMPYKELADLLNHSRDTTARHLPLSETYGDYNNPGNDFAQMIQGELRDPERYGAARVPTTELSRRHMAAIQKAMAAGETIPPEVLADYPDLAASPQAASGATAKRGEGTYKVVKEDAPGHWAVLAKNDGAPVGSLQLIERPGELKISTAEVGKAHRGQGFGKGMYRKAADLAKDLGKPFLASGYSVTDDAARVWKSLGGQKFTDEIGERWRIPTGAENPTNPTVPGVPPPAPESAAAPESTGAAAQSTFIPETPNAAFRTGVAGMRDAFEITAGGAKVTGYLANQDFPNQTGKPDRGELFYAEVPEQQRKQGIGYSLAKDALRAMAAHGSTTVNMSPTSAAGRALIEKLVRNGDIGGPIQSSPTGKAEYSIGRWTASAPKSATAKTPSPQPESPSSVTNAPSTTTTQTPTLTAEQPSTSPISPTATTSPTATEQPGGNVTPGDTGSPLQRELNATKLVSSWKEPAKKTYGFKLIDFLKGKGKEPKAPKGAGFIEAKKAITDIMRPVPGPKVEQILSPGAWADTFNVGDRIGLDWNQKPIEAAVVGRKGDYLVVQPDGQPGMTIQVYGTTARQENVKRLALAPSVKSGEDAGGIVKSGEAVPEGLKWEAHPGPGTQAQKDYDNPTDYYLAQRARQTIDKKFIDGETERDRATAGKKGAAQLRQENASKTSARRDEYSRRYRDIEFNLGMRTAETMRAEVEGRAKPEDKTVPATVDGFHNFWHSLNRGDSFNTPQGTLVVTQVEAWNMQPFLPGGGPGGRSVAFGRASHEVSGIETRNADTGVTGKYRMHELKDLLFPVQAKPEPAASFSKDLRTIPQDADWTKKTGENSDVATGDRVSWIHHDNQRHFGTFEGIDSNGAAAITSDDFGKLYWGAKKLRREDSKPADSAQPTKLPPGVPNPVRQGDRFLDTRMSPSPTVATVDGSKITLVAPYDRMVGADRHTLLGAIEWQLQHPDEAASLQAQHVFGMGDIVRYDGKEYEVGWSQGGMVRLQDLKTHERITPSNIPYTMVELVRRKGEARTPQFKEGDAVQWKDADGTAHTGEIESVPTLNGQAAAGEPEYNVSINDMRSGKGGRLMRRLKESQLEKYVDPKTAVKNFKEGDQVQWTNRQGKYFSGKVTFVYPSTGELKVETEQEVTVIPGLPPSHSTTVNAAIVEKLESSAAPVTSSDERSPQPAGLAQSAGISDDDIDDLANELAAELGQAPPAGETEEAEAPQEPEKTEPTQIAVTGNTLVHKIQLRSIANEVGGSWNREQQAWIFPASAKDRVQRISTGLIVKPIEGPVATKFAPAPADLAWSGDATQGDKDVHATPQNYYEHTRALAEDKKRYLDGYNGRLRGASRNGRGAKFARRAIADKQYAAQAEYDQLFRNVDRALGKYPADRMRAEVEGKPLPEAPAQKAAPTAAPGTTYTYEFKIKEEGDKWCPFPSQVYGTKEEAEHAAYAHFFNFFGATDYHVVPSGQPAQYRWNDEAGKAERIKATAPAETPAPQKAEQPTNPPGVRHPLEDIADAEEARLREKMRARKARQGIDAQASRPVPGFYSQLERTLEAKMPARASAQQVKGILDNPQNQVKQDERNWSGIDTWLDSQKGSVSKPDVLAFVKANEVQVEEVQLGGHPLDKIDARIRELSRWPQDPSEAKRPEDQAELDKLSAEWLTRSRDEGQPPKYPTSWQLPGGEEPRELVFTVPGYAPAVDKRLQEINRRQDEIRNLPAAEHEKQGDKLTAEYDSLENEGRHIRRNLQRVEQWGITDTAHYGDTGHGRTIAWARVNDRTAPNGDTLFHIEEIQSKREAEGRKQGYKPSQNQIRAEKAKLDKKVEVLREALRLATERWKTEGGELKRQMDAFPEPAETHTVTGSNGKVLYQGPDRKAAWRARGEYQDQGHGWADLTTDYDRYPDEWRVLKNQQAKLYQDMLAKREKLATEVRLADQQAVELDLASKRGVPNAPLLKNYEEFVIKRLLRYAAEAVNPDGTPKYQGITWTTGEQQAERYDLSKDIQRIAYEPAKEDDLEGPQDVPHTYTRLWVETKSGAMLQDQIAERIDGAAWSDEEKCALVPNSKLADAVGKDLADKILAGEGTEAAGVKQFTGLSLKLGGEKHKVLYDSKLPSFLNKYAKKWGAKVGTTEINTAHAPSVDELSPEQLQIARRNLQLPDNTANNHIREAVTEAMRDGYSLADFIGDAQSKETVHSLPITSSMRESVLQGQPLFYRPGEAKIPQLSEESRTPFPTGKSSAYHAEHADLKPIPVPERYKGVALAYLANSSAMELVGRATAKYPNDAVGPREAGLHLSPSDAGKLSRNLGIILAREFPGGAPAAALALRKGLTEAETASKSFVLSSADPQFDHYRDTAVGEELDHALQSHVAGTNRAHFGKSLDFFTAHPLYGKAEHHLTRTYDDYDELWQRAVEVGVRLMRPDGYGELGLSRREAIALAAHYARTLRREYGTQRARPVLDEIIRALGRRAGSAQKHPGSPGRQGPGRSGQGAGPALPGNEAGNRSGGAQSPVSAGLPIREGTAPAAIPGQLLPAPETRVDPAELKDDLKALGKIGAKILVVDKPANYQAWSTALTKRMGDIVNDLAEQAGLSPEETLRQIYGISRAVAGKLGVKVAEAPAAETKPAGAPIPDNKLIPEADKLITQFRKVVNGISNYKGDLDVINDNPKLMAFVKLVTGRSVADGSIDTKQVYDLLETAVNQEISQTPEIMDPNMVDVPHALARLRWIMSHLPTQAIRSAEQVAYQQFSTPPTEALVAARVLAPTKKDVVMETSAGTGGLAAFAKASGAHVLVNEIAPRRAELLRRSGYTDLLRVDGEQIDNLYDDLWGNDFPDGPTLVLMNPPFSAAGERGTSNTNDVGYRHVIQALRRLQPGGRLVAILGGGNANPAAHSGEGASLTAPTAQKFWQQVRDLGTVRANVRITGKEYAKYGTTFATRIVVIDKVPAKAGVPQAPVTGDFDSLEETWNALSGIAQDRQPLASLGTGAPDRLPGDRRPQDLGGMREPGGQSGTGVRGGPRAGEQSPAQGGSVRGPQHPAGHESGLQSQPGAEGNSPVRGGSDERLASEQDAPAPVAQDQTVVVGEDIGDYSGYKAPVPAEWGAKPHNAIIVETQTMASVKEPTLTIKPNVPQKVIDKGDLSDVQLAAISHIIQAHETFLQAPRDEQGKVSAEPRRMGFFLGDGTGVGKGRTLAASAVHYWNTNPEGKRKTIWISFNEELAEAARDDLDNVGGEKIPIYSLEKVGPGKKLLFKDGVLFVPYSKIATQQVTKADGTKFDKNASKADKASGQKIMRRLGQIIEWAGEEPLIIMDEAHKCVPAGTMIATPSGAAAIETLTAGDLVLGVNHETGQLEASPISATFKNVTAMDLVRVNDTWMTPNHPVWTGRGYIPADEIIQIDAVANLADNSFGALPVHLSAVPAALRGEKAQHPTGPKVLQPFLPRETHAGDTLRRQEALREVLRVVPEDILGNSQDGILQQRSSPVLQHELLGEVEDVAPGLRGLDSEREDARDCARPYFGSAEPSRSSGTTPQALGRRQPVSQAGSATQVAPDASGEGVEQFERWQRQAPADSRALVVAAPQLADGGSRAVRLAHNGEGQSNPLPDRHRGAGLENSRGVGRSEPHGQEGAGRRQAEGRVPAQQRLDAPPVPQSANSHQLRSSDLGNIRTRVVYNIETGTGNYFANGLLVHNCKNATATQENINETRKATKKPTLTGLAAIELQNKVPKGRVLYSSATGFSDVSNMAYANRLGLWGPGTAFKDFQDFRQQIDAGGIGIMELVARNLKAQGKYLSRFISYQGVVFDETVHEITPEQHAMLDRAGDAWRMVIDKFNQAADETTGNTDGPSAADASRRVRSAAMSQLWGAELRFYRSLYTAMKVPSLIKIIDEALEPTKEHPQGKSVVISVLETGQAAQDREIERLAKSGDEDLEGADISPVASLRDMVEKRFPTLEYETVKDEHGNDITRVKMGPDNKPVQNKAALDAKKALLADLDKLKGEFPDSALDQIINRYGTDKVAEMTKRSERLIRNPETGVREIQSRGSDLTKTNLHEMAAFQNGDKTIAIISNAASTGISLHSSIRAKNQRQRVHVMLQLKWSADMTMQDLGRTHRTAQAIPPHYILLSLNVDAEKRFAATIARRLEQLGALSRGERKAGGGATDFSKYNFESRYGRFAVDQLIDTLYSGSDRFGFLNEERMKQYPALADGRRVLQLMGLYDPEKESDKEDETSPDVPVNRFFNRLMILPIDTANQVFRAFSETMDHNIDSAKRMGMFDNGAELIKATHLTQDGAPLVVYEDPTTKAQAVFYKLQAQNPRYRYSWEALEGDTDTGFWPKRKTLLRVKASGRLLGVRKDGDNRTDAKTGRQLTWYNATAASGSGAQISQDDLSAAGSADAEERKTSKYELVRRTPAVQAEWQKQFDEAGPWHTTTESLITGDLLSIWQKVQEKEGSGKDARGKPIKVKIAKLDNGSRLIGALVEPHRVKNVLKALGHAPVVKPEDVMHRLLGGKKYDLMQGAELKRSTVSGEHRIELEGAYHFQRLFPQWGLYRETIGSRERWFIPTGERGLAVLTRVLKELPLRGEDEETAPDTEASRPAPGDEASTTQQSPAAYSDLRATPAPVPPATVGAAAEREQPDQGAESPTRFSGEEPLAARLPKYNFSTLSQQVKSATPRADLLESLYSRIPDLPSAPIHYMTGAPDFFHAFAMRFEPVQLAPEISGKMAAYVTNQSGMEYVYRMTGQAVDRGGTEVGGTSLSRPDVGILLRALRRVTAGFQVIPPTMQPLMDLAQHAYDSGRSIAFVVQAPHTSPKFTEDSLQEEIGHGLQGMLPESGRPKQHLGASTQTFVQHPIAQRAGSTLESGTGYTLRDPGTAAAEISVRFMVDDGYQELGLSFPEARTLAGQYLRLLRKEHGNAKTRLIADRIRTALARGRAQPGGAPGSHRPGESAGEFRDALGGAEPGREAVSGSPGQGIPAGPGGTAEAPPRNAGSREAGDVSELPAERRPGDLLRPEGTGSEFEPLESRAKYDFTTLSQQVKSATDEELLSSYPSFQAALKSAERRKLIDPGAVELADQLVAAKNAPVLRDLLSDEFETAGEKVPIPAASTKTAGTAGKGGATSQPAAQPVPPPPPAQPSPAKPGAGPAQGQTAAPAPPAGNGGGRSTTPRPGFFQRQADAIKKRYGFDLPDATYSGLGALKDVLVREASQLEKKAPEAYLALRKLAGSRAQASVIINTVAPQIQEALKGSGISWEQFRGAIMESRLQGIAQRWHDMADGVETFANVEDVIAAYNSGLRDLLEAMEGKRGLDDFLKQDADAMLANEEIESLREFLSENFEKAGDGVATLAPLLESAGGFEAVRKNPAFQKGLTIYKDLVEKPVAENHASNEGIFSDALGPLDTYIPLIPLAPSDQARFGFGRKTPYKKPKNAANQFATGLGEYTLAMDAFAQRISSALRANNKAAFIQALIDHGLVVDLKKGQNPPTTDLRGREIPVVNIDGRDFPASVMNVTQDRTIYQDGKAVHLFGKRILVPDWMRAELMPSLEASDLSKIPNLAQRWIGALNSFSLQGPLDFVFHSTNVLGVLMFKTPYAGTGIFSKTIGNTPVTKIFTAILNTINQYKAFDPEHFEGTTEKLYHMAKLGLIPGRYGKETYNRKIAEETGAELRRLTMGPVLFGPRGLDIKARLLMYDIAHKINPKVTDKELVEFIRAMGDYNRELEGRIERFVKEMGVGPFATAGTTMMRNAIDAWLGGGKMPKAAPWTGKLEPMQGVFPRGAAMRLGAMLGAGALGLLALWILGEKAMTGNFPWQNRNSKFLMTPVPPEFRYSATGRAIWGQNQRDGYINWAFFSPLPARGGRALGIAGGYNTAIAGGTFGQILEGAEKDILNSAMHPVTSGPVFKAGFVLATGMDPYISGLRDRMTGERTLKFMPAIAKLPAGVPTIAARLGEALLNVNSFYQSGAAAFGLGERAARQEDQGERWLRTITDVVAPRLLGQTYDVEATRRALGQERKASERPRGAARGSSSSSSNPFSSAYGNAFNAPLGKY